MNKLLLALLVAGLATAALAQDVKTKNELKPATPELGSKPKPGVQEAAPSLPGKTRVLRDPKTAPKAPTTKGPNEAANVADKKKPLKPTAAVQPAATNDASKGAPKPADGATKPADGASRNLLQWGGFGGFSGSQAQAQAQAQSGSFGGWGGSGSMAQAQAQAQSQSFGGGGGWGGSPYGGYGGWGRRGGWGRKLMGAQTAQQFGWGSPFGGFGGSNSWSNANAAAGSGSFGGPFGGGSNSWAQARAGAGSSSWGKRKLMGAQEAQKVDSAQQFGWGSPFGGFGGFGGSNSWSNANAAAGSGSFGGPFGGGSQSWAQAQAGAGSGSWGRRLSQTSAAKSDSMAVSNNGAPAVAKSESTATSQNGAPAIASSTATAGGSSGQGFSGPCGFAPMPPMQPLPGFMPMQPLFAPCQGKK